MNGGFDVFDGQARIMSVNNLLGSQSGFQQFQNEVNGNPGACENRLTGQDGRIDDDGLWSHENECTIMRVNANLIPARVEPVDP